MPGERGAALLEAIVALAVLALVGVTSVSSAVVSADAMGRARRHEARVVEAGAFLDVVSLWPREDLERHLGSSRQGPWVLIVERPNPALFELTLTDSLTREALVETALYREILTGAESNAR